MSSHTPMYLVLTINDCLLVFGAVIVKSWASHPIDSPGPAMVRERLDRALANTEWSLKFPQASVAHLVSPASDHCPIIIRCLGTNNLDAHMRKRKLYRFESMWLRGSWTLCPLSPRLNLCDETRRSGWRAIKKGLKSKTRFRVFNHNGMDAPSTRGSIHPSAGKVESEISGSEAQGWKILLWNAPSWIRKPMTERTKLTAVPGDPFPLGLPPEVDQIGWRFLTLTMNWILRK